MLDFMAYKGIKALAQYNSKKASHARVLTLFYVSMRAATGYFWGEIENMANDLALSRTETGRFMRELESCGALELISHSKLPPHIRQKIQKDYDLKPAKKVWRVTGNFVIAGTTYIYEGSGNGGAPTNEIKGEQSPNVGISNILNVGISKCQDSQHNSLNIEEKDKKEKEDSLSTPANAVSMGAAETSSTIQPEPQAQPEPIAKTGKAKERDTVLLGKSIPDRLAQLTQENIETGEIERDYAPPPRVSKGMKSAPDYLAIERILMHTSHPRKADGFLLADVLRWLYLEVQATPAQVLNFLRWYHKKLGDQYGLPKKLVAWQGDGATDKGRWADWIEETKPIAPKAKPLANPTCPHCRGLGKISINAGTRYKVKMEYHDCTCIDSKKAVA